MDEAARRQALKGEVAALASDLRQWVDWAQATGADLLPAGEAPAEPAPVAVRQPQPVVRAQPVPVPSSPAAAAAPVAGESLEAIRADLGNCTRCQLAQGRKQIVFGVGSPNADLVIVGEAPGRNEDLTGEPFVGRAGQLLNRMLEAIGLTRDQVYICNVIKCRPPQNRDPLPQEVATCSPFMHRQVRSLAPKVIMTVGRFASQNVIGSDKSMGQLRRETASMQGVPVVATYHPAFLLRQPRMKRQAWEDLLRVRALLRASSVAQPD